MARISSRERLWDQLSRTCFQDRVMPYAYWLSATTNTNHKEHRKVVNQSVIMLDGSQFVDLLGEGEFISSWKGIREVINTERVLAKQSVVILDGLWSLITTGFAFGGISAAITKPLNKQLRKTYLTICGSFNKSIYEVAKDTDRAYNRVHSDVERLQAAGLIHSSMTERNGRRVRVLNAASMSGVT